MSQALKLRPDVIIMDLMMPKMNCVAAHLAEAQKTSVELHEE